TPTPGATHSYAVTAMNALGESAPSVSDTGYRGPAPVTSFELSTDGSTFTDIGLFSSYADTSAPAPSVAPGAASATDGAFADHVALTLVGESAAPGAPRDYLVRAVSSAGTGATAPLVTGYRGVGALSYQWQASAVDADAAYTDLA